MAGESGVFAKVVGWATILGVVIALAAWQWPRSPAGGDRATGTTSTGPRTSTNAPPPVPEDGGSSRPTTDPPPVVAGQVKRQGTTTFATGTQGDLDTDAPDWGVSGSRRHDRIYSGQMLIYSPAALGYFGNHAPTYAECQAFTAYGQPEDSRWAPGKSFCVRTDEGRYASLTVQPADTAPRWSLTASITVWKSQDDAP